MIQRPATSMPDGSERQCAVCLDDIAIGAPAAENSHRVDCHAACVSLTPSAARAAATAAKLDPKWLREATKAKDIGDQIADLLDERRGKSVAAPTRPAAASAATLTTDFGDAVADAFDRLYRGAVAQ